jgi:hypothetical protein
MNKIAHEHNRLQVPSLPVQARFERSLLDAIDSWRRRQADIPSRPEAIRRLCSQSLGTMQQPPGRRRRDRQLLSLSQSSLTSIGGPGS